ncbi:MAG TPA: DUF1549 domain-containing protein, partial [Pirellulaceae bacterium]|nr:DUF1549 domain-containing protein [Pirellulaceae bacterium]
MSRTLRTAARRLVVSRLAALAVVVLSLEGLTLIGVAASARVASAQEAKTPPNLVVSPAEMKLDGNFARAQILVSAGTIDGKTDERSEDLTTKARFATSDAKVATVNEAGLVLAKADGQAKITVSVDGATRDVLVTVGGVLPVAAVNFTEQIRPILNKTGCAMAACHAAQHGKGGFKLSVFGSEPDTDHKALARDLIQRRVDLVQPESSLALLKPSMQVPHGGGRRIEKDSVDYQIFLNWIKAGCPGPTKDDVEVVKLHVTPARRVGTQGLKQQLRVEAEYANGKRRDVTASARYDSMDDSVVGVSRDGVVTTTGQGQAPVMIRFEGQAEIAMFVVPYADSAPLAGWKNHNFVDELASAKFRELGIEPSQLCDDSTFVRRAFLDAIGTLPTTDETLAFLNSDDPEKRTKLVDRLLGMTGDPSQDIYNDWYAAYWSLKWSDLIRNSSRELGEQGMWALHNWVRESFRVNKPFDQFVRELITAKGSIYSSGPANFFRVNGNPPALTEAVSQTFLGVRLECAKCHHHPFEKYSQDDYYQ